MGFLGRMRPDNRAYLTAHSIGPVAWNDSITRTSDDRLFVTGKSTGPFAFETGPNLSSGGAYVMALAPTN